ncbi:hypothetical protein D9M69_721720 [compost metagenome]
MSVSGLKPRAFASAIMSAFLARPLPVKLFFTVARFTPIAVTLKPSHTMCVIAWKAPYA